MAWEPTSNIVYNVSVAFLGNETFKDAGANELLDLRFSTNITSLDDNPRNVTINAQYDYHFQLVSSSLFGLKNKSVLFSINGTSTEGTQYATEGSNSSNMIGNVQFAFEATASGVYSMNATFAGDDNYKPCETFVAINASVTPFGLQFEVSPTEFEPSDSVLLNATIMDPFTGKKVTGGVRMNVTFFRVWADGSNQTLYTNMTGSGEATYRTSYPTSGTCAYVPRLDPVSQDGQIPQGTVSNPVQLTVSKSTRILLNVSKDNSSTWHLIEGWVMWKSSGVANRPVTIDINGTKCSNTTDSNGHFMLSLDLQPKDDNITNYIITASFEDNITQPTNATAWAKTLDGQEYASCTTTQYGYKPSSNMTVLTVDPRVTQVLKMTKSPDEMQQEAKADGWFELGHEWSWWYPWYRLHVKIHINPSIDVGFNPILPWGETSQWNGLQTFINVIEEIWQDIVTDLVGLLGSYVLAKILSFTPAWLAIEALKAGAQGVLLALAWYNRDAVLAISLGSIIMGLISCSFGVAEQFIETLSFLAWGRTISFLYLSVNKMITVVGGVNFRTWVDSVETIIDFIIGVTAFAHYEGII